MPQQARPTEHSRVPGKIGLTSQPDFAAMNPLAANNANAREKIPCVCSAVVYCCSAVAPRATAVLLGRFLPRLGRLSFERPFFLPINHSI